MFMISSVAGLHLRSNDDQLITAVQVVSPVHFTAFELDQV